MRALYSSKICSGRPDKELCHYFVKKVTNGRNYACSYEPSDLVYIGRRHHLPIRTTRWLSKYNFMWKLEVLFTEAEENAFVPHWPCWLRATTGKALNIGSRVQVICCSVVLNITTIILTFHILWEFLWKSADTGSDQEATISFSHMPKNFQYLVTPLSFTFAGYASTQ